MAKSTRYVPRRVEGPDGKWQQVTLHLGESPLLWLHGRGRLSDRQLRAGEAIRGDWERAGLGSRVTMAWDSIPSEGRQRGAPRAVDPTLAQLSARRRFDGAIQAAGPGLSDILWRVACAGEGLAAAESALGWPSRAGKLVLLFALDRVADYYRL
jgi:hypothetical protein